MTSFLAYIRNAVCLRYLAFEKQEGFFRQDKTQKNGFKTENNRLAPLDMNLCDLLISELSESRGKKNKKRLYI